jgi:hypothetical protein
MSFSSSDDEVPLTDGLNFDLDSIESSFTSEAEAGQLRAKSRDGSIRVSIIPSQQPTDELEEENFNDEFKTASPQRQESVERLSKLLTSSQPKSSKIDYGHEVSLPTMTRKISATTLMEMVKKEKEHTREKTLLEQEAIDDAARAQSPEYRPLTSGSSHSRLNTPNLYIPSNREDIQSEIPDVMMSITDPSSHEKLPSGEGRARLTDSPLSALPSRGAPGDINAHGTLDTFESVMYPNVEVNDEGSLIESPADDASQAGEPVMRGSTNSPSPDGQLSKEVQVLLVDTVKMRGKVGRFTVNRVQQFPEEMGAGDVAMPGFGGRTMPDFGGRTSPMGSPGTLAREKSLTGGQDSLDNASTLSARSSTSHPNIRKETGQGNGVNIFKPFKGHHLTASNSLSSLDIFNHQLAQGGAQENNISFDDGDSTLADSFGKSGKLVADTISTNIQGMSLNKVTPAPKMMQSISTSMANDDQRLKSFGQEGTKVVMPLHGLPRPAADGDSVELSGRSSTHSMSMSVTTEDDKDPFKRLTLQESHSSVNKLYDASQRGALAMLYMNESSEKSLRDDDTLSSASENLGLIPYRIHNRIMGWKLTTPKHRKQLLDILDSQDNEEKANTRAKAPIARQAQAWGSAVQRMHRARDRTPQGYFKKMLRERADQRGDVMRGANRPGSVQSRLIAETDKAGLHRAIAAGLVELEQETFIEQVREKSREQSRQRTTSRQNTGKSPEGSDRGLAPEAKIKTGSSLFVDGRVEGPVSPW